MTPKPAYICVGALLLTLGVALCLNIGWLTPRETGVLLVIAGGSLLRLSSLFGREFNANREHRWFWSRRINT